MLKTVKEILSYVMPYKAKLFLGLGSLFVSVYLILFIPGIFRDIINTLQRGDYQYSEILYFAGIILAIGLVRGVFLYFARYIIIGVSRVAEYNFRNKLVKHMLHLDPEFYDKNKSGDLISRITSDLDQVRMIFGPGIMYPFNVLFLLILSFRSMTEIDTGLTIIAIVPLFIMAIFIKKIGVKYYERSKVVQEELANMTSFVSENLQGVRVIKSFVKEGFVMDHFKKMNLKFVKENITYAKYTGMFRPVMYTLVGISTALILFMGGQMYVDGQKVEDLSLIMGMNSFTGHIDPVNLYSDGIAIVDNGIITDIGTLVELFWYIEILSPHLMAMGWILSIYQRGTAAYHRIEKVLETESKINDNNTIEGPIDLKGDIEIKNLSYGYENHKVIEDISFTINEGEKIALIGPTGSGKTTFVSLLLRLYEAPEKTIFFNGVAIEEIPLRALREHIGYVPQENYIFPDSIYENINFGSNDMGSLDRIVEVSRLAEFEEEIESFENGYEEKIGEKGVTLSGGQKQRLSIARALSGDPSVYIFDDSFSNIDSDTEKKILNNLKKDYPDKTVIIIAHRGSTIQNVDKVLVLDHGKILEMGTPKELKEKQGFFAKILEHEAKTHDLEAYFK